MSKDAERRSTFSGVIGRVPDVVRRVRAVHRDWSQERGEEARQRVGE